MNSTDVLNKSSARLDVDLSAVVSNYQTLASQSTHADCAAVVKANAYGLGMEQVAPAIFHNTICRTFFVANIVEAVDLRKLLPEAVIYVFNGVFADQIDIFQEYDLRPVLNDLSQVALWEGTDAPCAIHFDTGINRLGLNEDETDKFLNSKSTLNIKLALSHLISSEKPQDENNKIQLDRFKKISSALADVPASLANSGGVYLGSDYHFDLLRPGIMLYGGNPGLGALPSGLKNVAELKARILQIRKLGTGMSVGYNALWTAKRPSRVAILNVGYADGPLNTSDFAAHVYVAGALAPVIGKVSMDMIAVDITDANFDSVGVTDFAEVLGSNITLEMASEVSTLGQYEFLIGIGQRYNKNYKLGT